MLAHSSRRNGRYIAFNKTIATAATRIFPRQVACKTAHAMAYAAVGHRYTARLNGPRTPSWRIGQELGITKPARIGHRDISTRALSHATLQAVTNFCHSADGELTTSHVLVCAAWTIPSTTPPSPRRSCPTPVRPGTTYKHRMPASSASLTTTT
jgi:hypothetical protein